MMFIAYHVEEMIDGFDETKDADSEMLFPYFKDKAIKNWRKGTFFSNCMGANLTSYGLDYKTAMV